jgi:uncharacterized protein (DUF362 family)
VLRSLIAAAIAVTCLHPLCAGEPQVAPPPVTPITPTAPAAAPAPVAPAISTVFFAQDEQTLNSFQEDVERSRAMVNSVVMAVTGQNDLTRAWRTLVTPSDRVGIKISATGGRYFSTHPGIVSAIVSGLESAGVPRDRIFVWDRNTEDLKTAGYLPRKDRYDVRAIDPPRGFDRDAQLIAPVLGKLMWGDLLFAEKLNVPFGKQKNEADQLSSTSHLARIVSRDLTKIINVPTLSDAPGCAIAGAIYNVTVPNVDNWRRFTQTEGSISSSPIELYADPRISGKCVLHIMDGLLAQYAGGPGFSPNYAYAHETIYASKDPVALDATALRRIEAWRVQAKLPPLTRRAAWLQDAAEMGLGNCAENRIELKQVEPVR